MATAPVPGASRREEAEKANISFELEGKHYTIWPGELSASLTREFRQATGMSCRAAIALMGSDPDLDILVSLIWLARRQSGEKITIDDVPDFTYSQADSLKFVDPIEDPEDPEL